MRHVKDPQFDRRLSELEAHSRKIRRLSSFPTILLQEGIRQTKTLPPLPPISRLDRTAELKEPRSLKTSTNASGLSSPPPSAGTVEDERPRTPARKDRSHCPPAATGSPMQLSSPPASVLRHASSRETVVEEENTREIAPAYEKDNAATPSQKVDALDGLLKLRETT